LELITDSMGAITLGHIYLSERSLETRAQ